MIRDTQEAWAVAIDGKSFALDGYGVRWIAAKRKDAAAFAKELQPHVSGKCKPIKVLVTIIEVVQ